MAIPTDYIFTSGTCLKSEVYQLIIDKLKSAGWTDISSLASADFVVLQSTGNTGDKNLLLNLRDTNAAAANSIVTTDYCVMSYRLQDTYTPGAAGVAGVFGRPSLAWTALYIAPVAAITTTLGKDTTVTYHIYADASKLILVLEYPSVTGFGPTIVYMGEPDTLLVSDSASRGVLVAASNNAVTAANLQICNTSDGAASVTAPYALKTYALLPEGDPNIAGKRIVSPIYYGIAAESFRGKMDGLKCMFYNATTPTINTSDTVTMGAEIYYVAIAHSQGNTSFPSRALLVRVQ